MPKILNITLGVLTSFVLSTWHVSARAETTHTTGNYGPHALQSADLYQPATEVVAKGLVVWVHGGSWISGDKSDGIAKLIAPLLSKGIAVLSINYRLRDEGAFPRSVEDVELVLAAIANGGCASCEGTVTWQTAKNYARYGLMVSGYSAGGYLATMGGMRHLASMPSSSLKCIGNVAGPVDLRNYPGASDKQKYAVTVFSGGNLSDAQLTLMSPVAYMAGGAWNVTAPKVKWYLRFNTRDRLTQFDRTTQFTDALKRTGARGSMETVSESGGGHGIYPATAQKFIVEPMLECLAN